MHDIKLFFPLVLLQIGQDQYRGLCLYWPSVEMIVSEPETFFRKAERILEHDILEANRVPFPFLPLFPIEIFNRTISSEPGTGRIICSCRIDFSVFNDEKESFLKVPVDYLYWSITGENRCNVWIPVADLFFSVSKEKDLEEEIKNYVENWFRITMKKDEEYSLIAPFLQVQKMEMRFVPLEIDYPSPMEIQRLCCQETEIKNLSAKDVQLRSFNSTDSSSILFFGSEIEQMIDLFSLPKRESVLLIGPSGVGKTALWRKFVARFKQIRNSVEFYETDAISLASQNTNPGAVEELLLKMSRWLSDRQAIIHMGNLWEYEQTGKGTNKRESIADSILPYIDRGAIATVFECTEEQYHQLEQTNPSLLLPFLKIELSLPTDHEVEMILHKIVKETMKKKITNGAIRQICFLHRRYSLYSVMPGAALAFLNRLNDTLSPEMIVDEDLVNRMFAEQTGLPLFLLANKIPYEREKALHFFTERVIGQGGENSLENSKTCESDQTASALKSREDQTVIPVVVDLIAAVKAGLARRNRPIASLLFIGPTGVGKTEMAKALAEFLYHDSKRMIRIDMSEYADFTAADRLINGTSDSGEGLLTAQVRSQPFGVVLLDEFEKASPNVFDLLLQILGEGRLTDSRGKLADFRNCVIILTSNLGVEGYGQVGLGFETSESVHSGTGDLPDPMEYFTEQVGKLVRPELLNRIDRIVPFQPLQLPVLRKILDKEIRDLMKRNGLIARNIELNIDHDVREEVLRQGYLPKYGARPLRRAIENLLLPPLADLISSCPIDKKLQVDFKFENNKIRLYPKQFPSDSKDLITQKDLLIHLSQLRYILGKITQSSTLHTLNIRQKKKLMNEMHIKKRSRQAQKVISDIDFILKKDGKDFFSRALDLYDQVKTLELSEKQKYYCDRPLDPQLKIRNEEILHELKLFLIDYYHENEEIKSDHFLLHVFCPHPKLEFFFSSVYKKIIDILGDSCTYHQLVELLPNNIDMIAKCFPKSEKIPVYFFDPDLNDSAPRITKVDPHSFCFKPKKKYIAVLPDHPVSEEMLKMDNGSSSIKTAIIGFLLEISGRKSSVLFRFENEIFKVFSQHTDPYVCYLSADDSSVQEYPFCNLKTLYKNSKTDCKRSWNIMSEKGISLKDDLQNREIKLKDDFDEIASCLISILYSKLFNEIERNL